MRKRSKFAALGAVMLGIALVAAGCSGGGTTPATSAGGDTAAPTESGSTEAPWTFEALITDLEGEQAEGEYSSTEAGSGEGMSFCVLFPHLKDPYWVATAYGIYQEAQRVGASFDLFEAGGYENLPVQLDQTENCITAGTYDALVVGAISADGNCATMQDALDKGIVVVDLVNGTLCDEAITSNPLYTQTLVSYKVVANVLAQYMVDLGEPMNLLELLGPEGVPWSDDMVVGVDEAIKGSDITVVASPRGDTDQTKQLGFATDALQADPSINAIIGASVNALAATVAVRDKGVEDSVKVFGAAMIEDTYNGIKDGTVAAGSTDMAPIIAKMGVDTAVKSVTAGEAGLDYKAVGPIPAVISADNIEEIPEEWILAPAGFTPVFNYAP